MIFTKKGLATFWAIFSQTHPVTLVFMKCSSAMWVDFRLNREGRLLPISFSAFVFFSVKLPLVNFLNQ
jgi:hypothetical protein